MGGGFQNERAGHRSLEDKGWLTTIRCRAREKRKEGLAAELHASSTTMLGETRWINREIAVIGRQTGVWNAVMGGLGVRFALNLYVPVDLIKSIMQLLLELANACSV